MTTTDTAETAPEVLAARAALARIPDEWRNDRLDESVLRRASLQALDRALATRAAMAEVSHDVATEAIARVADGDMSGLDELLEAQARKDAAARLRGQLKVPPIDADGLRAAFAIAEKALNDSTQEIRLPAVAWEAELAAWRQHSAGRLGAPVDPPLPTDLCRAASKKAASVSKDVDATLAWHQSWREWVANPAGDPLSLLASAAGVLEQRKTLVPKVQDAAKLIGQANAARKAAGLVWRAPA